MQISLASPISIHGPATLRGKTSGSLFACYLQAEGVSKIAFKCNLMLKLSPFTYNSISKIIFLPKVRQYSVLFSLVGSGIDFSVKSFNCILLYFYRQVAPNQRSENLQDIVTTLVAHACSVCNQLEQSVSSISLVEIISSREITDGQNSMDDKGSQ